MESPEQPKGKSLDEILDHYSKEPNLPSVMNTRSNSGKTLTEAFHALMTMPMFKEVCNEALRNINMLHQILQKK